MNIEITEDRARWRSTDYTWNVRIDGQLIAVAKTPGAGDYVALEVQARNDVAKLKQALSALEAVDAAITAELAHTYDDECYMCNSASWQAHRAGLLCPEHLATVQQALADEPRLMPEGDHLDADGMRVAAPVDEPISGGAVLRHSGLPNPLARIQAAESVDPQYSDAARFAEDPCCPCGAPALFFVQYPGKTYAYCPECYRDLNAGRPPLLAQCAAIIRRCLGSTTGAGSIIDELRRVDRALRTEGW